MDAWIEIKEERKKMKKLDVASFVDAWIEIIGNAALNAGKGVASFVDAWIEILHILKRPPKG